MKIYLANIMKNKDKTAIFRSFWLNISFFLLITIPATAQFHQTPKVVDVSTLSGGSNPDRLFAPNKNAAANILYFAADYPSLGQELGLSTVYGNVLQTPSINPALDINLGVNGSQPRGFVEMNGRVYFFANNPMASAFYDNTLTVRSPNDNNFWNGSIAVVGNDYIVFTYELQNASPKINAEPWVFKRATNTLENIIDLNPTNSGLPGAIGSYANDFTTVGSKVFFTANIFAGAFTDNRQLFVYDPSQPASAGVNPKQITVNPSGSAFRNPAGLGPNPNYFVEMGGYCYFMATANGTDTTLFRSDGNIVEVAPNSNGIYIPYWFDAGANKYRGELINANGTLYFAYDDGVNGRELWRYDPTGAQLVRDIISGSTGSNPRFLTNVNGILYFNASTELVTNPAIKYGREICRSDGTTAGTFMIKDINPGGNSSDPAAITDIDGVVYFIANGGSEGREVWYSDGTAQNTKLYKDTRPGSGDGYSFTTTGGVSSPKPNITPFLTTTPSAGNDYALAFTGFSGNDAIGNELYFAKPCPVYELSYTAPTLCQGTGDVAPSLNLLEGDNTDYASNPIDLGLGTFTANRPDIVIDPTTGIINMTLTTPTPDLAVPDTITYKLDGWNGCVIEEKFALVILSGGTTPLRKTTTFISSGVTFYNSSGNNSDDAQIGMTLAPTGTKMYVINGTTIQERNFPEGTVSNASFITGLNSPAGITTDASGNIYITEKNAHIIKVYNSSGVFQFNIGTGTQGDADGTATTAQFRFPTGIDSDWKGNIYVADMLGNRVRKLDGAGNVSTFATIAGGLNFWLPTGITTDFQGNVYMADRRNNRIIKITPNGTSSLLAGSTEGFVNGTGSAARFAQPSDIAIDPQGNVFVVDRKNHSIRKIVGNKVTTEAGTNSAGTTDNVLAVFSRFTSPNGIMADLSGNLYVVDNYDGNSKIRKIFVDNSAGQVIGARGICKGGGGTLTIQKMDGSAFAPSDITKWQRSNDFGQNWADITGTSGVTTYNYTSLNLQQTTLFRVVVQVGVCQSASNYAAIVVFDPPQATILTPDTTICGSPTITLKASGGSNGDYRWYYQRQSESAKTEITGAANQNSQINVTPTETTTYYVGLYDPKCGGAAITDSVLVTQNPLPNTPTLTGTPYSTCGDGTVTATATGAVGAERYIWLAADNVTVLKTSADAGDNSFVTPTLTATTNFSVKISNGNCESTPVAFTATHNPKPADPTLVGEPFARCGTGNITLTASGAGAGEEYVWYDASNNVIAGATTANYTAVGLSTTTNFSVAIKNTTTNCESNKVSVTATINAKPANPTFTTNPVIRCGNGEVTLTANGATGTEQYIWYDDAGGTTVLKTSADASGNTFTTPTLTASRDYYVVISNGVCPGDIQTISVVVNPAPTDPTIVGAPFARCGTGDVTMTASGAGAGEEYVWYDASNNVIAGATTANYTAVGLSTTTNFSVAIKNTTTNCESNKVSVTATITAEPATVTFPTAPFQRCGTGDITITASGAVGTEQYIWYDDAGGATILKTSTDATDNTYTATGLATTRDYYVRITNGTCQSPIQTITATVNTIPADPAIVGGPFERCDVGTVSIAASGAGAGEDYVWFSDASGTTQVGTGSPFTPTVSNNTDFWVAISNGNCRSNLVQVSVVVYPKPTPVITGATIVCEGSSNVIYSTPATSNNFTWTITGTGATFTGQGTNQITVNWGAGPAGTVAVREQSNVICFTDATLNIDLRTPPAPQITNSEGLDAAVGSGTFCDRNTYTFETPFTTGNLYTWDVNGGTFTTTANPNKILVTWNGTAGNITVTERIDGTDCQVSTIYTATLKPSPTPDITGDTLVCETTTATYTATNNSGNTYTWNVTGGTILSGAGTNSITVNWGTGPAQGRVVLHEVGTNGCGIYDTLRVSIVEYPVPQVRNGLRCGAGRVKVYAKYATAVEYRWYDAQTGGNLLGVTTDTLFVTPSYATTTTIWVAGVNRGNCEGNRVSVIAEISQQNIEATVSAQIVNVCARATNGKITLNVSGGIPPYNYQWSNGATTKDIENLAIGTYTVTITDDGGCTTVRTFEIIEDKSQSVEVDAGANGLVGKGESIELKATSPDNSIVSYTWTPATGLSNPNIANPMATPDTLTTYFIEVVNANGCVGRDSVIIDVTTFNLFIPNTFTPNEDGVNDRLQVFGEYIESIEFSVYDRFGNLVYQTKDADQIVGCETCANGWNGKDLAGNVLPDGNYVWQIKGSFVGGRKLLADGKNAGSVLIIR